MVGNVLLYFYTIASALRLKTPLPPYLPPANKARLRLIQKIRQLPVVQNKVVLTEENDERYIFYYAYALVMEDVIRELERLGQWSQDLFGVITPSLEFEAWFTDDGHLPDTPATSDQRHGDHSEAGGEGGYFRPRGAGTSQALHSSSATKAAATLRSTAQDADQPYGNPVAGVRSLSKPVLVSTPGKYRYSPDNNRSRGLSPSQQRYSHQQRPSIDRESSYTVEESNAGSLNDQRSDIFLFDPQGGSIGSSSHRNGRDPSPSNRQEGLVSGKRSTLPPLHPSRPTRSQSLQQTQKSTTSLRGEHRDYGAIPTAPALSGSASSGNGTGEGTK